MARDLPAVLPGGNGRKPPTPERDARGRFVAGASPGPGRPANPFARYQAELRAALLAEVTPADVRTVLRQVIKIAKRGHLPAVELLLKWVLGAPPAPVDPDRLDEDELRVRRGRPALVDWLALSDEPADRAPAEADPEETAAAVDTTEADPLAPSLRQTLAWAVEELAQAQYALRLQRPPDPAAGWEAFAAQRVEFDPQAAVDVDQLLVTYGRWCAGHGAVPVEEAKVWDWLTQHGASRRTGVLSQTVMVVGVRVVA
jgi:hypothetical protein